MAGSLNFDFSTGCDMEHTTQPQIIPRKEHNISRKQVSPNALRTLYRLREKGIVKTVGRSVFICDLERLKRRARWDEKA